MLCLQLKTDGWPFCLTVELKLSPPLLLIRRGQKAAEAGCFGSDRMPQDPQADSVFSSDTRAAEDGLLTGKEPGSGLEALAQPTHPLFQQRKAEMIKHAAVPCLWSAGETNSPLCYSTVVSLHLSCTPSVKYIFWCCHILPNMYTRPL